MQNNLSVSGLADPAFAKPSVNLTTMLVLLLTAVGLGTGLYAFIVGHHHVYAVTREVPWGILISTYAFFAITSTGLCILAAISHALNFRTCIPSHLTS